MTTPRCPYCNAQGLKHLAAKEVGAFSVVYCSQCGAIYGVVPVQKRSTDPPAPVVAQKEPSPAQPQKLPPEQPPPPRMDSPLAEIDQADWSKKVPYNPQKIAARMRAAGINQGTQYLRIATPDGPPNCRACQVEMEQVTLPYYYEHGGRQVWICPNYRLCKQWEIVDTED